MKHNVHYLFLVLLALISSTSLNAQSQSSGQIIEDGEAFYIYRNDGDFNGFFYDEVEEMRYSKVDLEGVEHDDYVIQEVVTADSLYRIPLCAIDSIGFVQPEIIMGNICSLSDDNSPYLTYRVDFDGEYSYNFHYLHDWVTQKVLKPGDIVHYGMWHYQGEYGLLSNHGMFLAKVKSIKSDNNFYDKELFGEDAKGYYVECEPIESMDEVFKQFVTLEKEYATPDGRQMRRMAGYNQLRRKISDRRDLTFVDLNGRFNKAFTKGSFSANIGVDINAKATGSVTYNIRGSKYYIKTELACQATVGLSLNITGTLNETTTQYFAKDVAFYFPSFLPIFQVSPMPGTFVRSSGDVTLNLSTPKLGAKASFAVIISDDGISGSPVQFKRESDTIDPSQSDNSWSIEASINGSTQTGVVFPFMIETNSWMRRFLNCSIGAEVFVGPKFSGSINFDFKSIKSGDVYGTLANSQIGFTPLDVAVEGSCSARIGIGEDSKMELFKTEMEIGRMQLNLFPQFDSNSSKLKEQTYNYQSFTQCVVENHSGEDVIVSSTTGYTPLKSFNLTMYPHGMSMPCSIYAGVYNKDKELVNTFKGLTTGYGLFRQPESIEVKDIRILQNGEFHICPVIEFLGYKLPVWSQEQVVIQEAPITLAGGMFADYGLFMYVHGIQRGDVVQLEYIPSDDDGKKKKIYYNEQEAYEITTNNYTPSEVQTYTLGVLGIIPFNEDTDKLFAKAFKMKQHNKISDYGSDVVYQCSKYRAKVIRGDRTLYSEPVTIKLDKNNYIMVW